MSRRHKLMIEHVAQVVQVTDCGARSLTKNNMKNLAILQGAQSGYSVLIGRDGTIVDIGTSEEINERHSKDDIHQVIDGSEKCLLPGLVDAHTHPVWAGDRVHEFALKLSGSTYMDIHKMGGGIHFTVNHTRQADEQTLFTSFSDRLCQMIQSGTTLVECKSGYGLDLENEIKMLRVIERARIEGKIDISSTYCGAHAVPKGKTADEVTQDIISKQIPAIKQLIDAGELHVDNIDVFCEEGVFDLCQTKVILQAGKEAQLQINFHGEELHRLGSAEMGAELGAKAISHLEEISDAGITAMASSGSVAVVLPTTAYNLRLKPPPVRDMIEAGVIVALGSDFNPNAHCSAMVLKKMSAANLKASGAALKLLQNVSMVIDAEWIHPSCAMPPLVMNLACVTLKMSMSEALVAGTLNSAHALGKSDMHGSIEVGKYGNLILVDAPRWEHLIYQMGNHNNLISTVVWRGDVVYQKG